QEVDWTHDGTGYSEDVPALFDAINAAGEVTDQPSLIVLRTVIAWPAPNAQNTEAAHGSALGAEEVAATKEILGFDPAKSFDVDPEVLAHTRKLIERGEKAEEAWRADEAAWAEANPEGAKLLERLQAGELPADIADALPFFEADAKGIATRAASGKVINALAPVLPELWGGSADLAGSNNTTIAGAPSFVPEDRSTDEWKGDPYAGRVLHFGIREHAMGAILNGIVAHSPTKAFGGTFFQFSDYMRGAVRVGALSKLPVIHVWTHDSVGLGEDGPTHQPVEHLAAVRAIPGLDVVRPADANETAAAWLEVLKHHDRPSALILTRQALPTFPRGKDGYADTSGVAKGGYVLLDSPTGTVDVVLLGTGSEVQYAVAARDELAKEGIGARVVSLPCLEWFEAQDQDYRDSVIPPSVKARVSVEAGVKQGWREYVGDAGRIVSLEHFGASASGALLFKEYGFTPEAVVTAAKESLAAINKGA
ncbi:MAG TPA: transketolase C-terminal domain-containing protein, partial [Nocardioides sp.]